MGSSLLETCSHWKLLIALFSLFFFSVFLLCGYESYDSSEWVCVFFRRMVGDARWLTVSELFNSSLIMHISRLLFSKGASRLLFSRSGSC